MRKSKIAPLSLESDDGTISYVADAGLTLQGTLGMFNAAVNDQLVDFKLRADGIFFPITRDLILFSEINDLEVIETQTEIEFFLLTSNVPELRLRFS